MPTVSVKLHNNMPFPSSGEICIALARGEAQLITNAIGPTNWGAMRKAANIVVDSPEDKLMSELWQDLYDNAAQVVRLNEIEESHAYA